MEVIETKRTITTYAGRSSGHNNGTGVTIIGPVLVQIDVVEYEHHTSSYYVTLDGRHQFGGFAGHLDENGLPHASFLTIGTRTYIETPCTSTDPAVCANEKHDHFGQIEAALNGGEPVPESDLLVCADCRAPMHYDYGDESYHHNDDGTPLCFLIR